MKCPFLTESLDVLQNLLSDDNESTTCDEEEDMDSEMDGVSLDESSSGQGGLLRKRKVSNMDCNIYPPTYMQRCYMA